MLVRLRIGPRSRSSFCDSLQGLNSLPGFYGSKVRSQEVSGFRSGLKEGGKSVFYGYADAFTGLVTTPKRGYKKAVSLWRIYMFASLTYCPPEILLC